MIHKTRTVTLPTGRIVGQEFCGYDCNGAEIYEFDTVIDNEDDTENTAFTWGIVNKADGDDYCIFVDRDYSSFTLKQEATQ